MWAARRTIGEKRYAGMGALLLLTVLEGGVALWGSARVAAGLSQVTQRSGEMQGTIAIYASLFKIESNVRSMLWAGLDNDRELYTSAKQASVDEFASASRGVDALAGSLTSKSDQALAASLR